MLSDRPDTGIGKLAVGRCPSLVIAIAHEGLRRWAVHEVAAEWHGTVHVIYGLSDLFRGQYGRDFVLLICSEQLDLALRRHSRRWSYLARRGSIVLVEAAAKMERIETYLPAVNSVLLAGLHEGKASAIIRAVKMGVFALPPEMLERILVRRFGQAMSVPSGKPADNGDDS